MPNISPLVFEMSEWSQLVDASKVLIDTEALLDDISGNHAYFFVKTTDMRKTFKYQVDSSDVEHATTNSPSDIMYHVDVSAWNDASSVNLGAINLNAANANLGLPISDIVDSSYSLPRPRPIADGDNTNGAYDFNKMLLKHDFMRKLSNTLFGTPHFVDLFNNENSVLEDLASVLSTEYKTKVYDHLSALAATPLTHVDDDAGDYTQTNLGRKLLKHMLHEDATRFYFDADVSGTINGVVYDTSFVLRDASGDSILDIAEPRPLPFVDGDCFEFSVTINEAANQRSIDGVDGDLIIDASPSTEYKYTVTVVCVPDTQVSVNERPTDMAEDTALSGPSAYNDEYPYGTA